MKITFLLLTIGLGLCFISIINAEPVVQNVFYNPNSPAPLSTINFSVSIVTDDKIDDVRLILQECMDDICFIDKYNISMNYSYSCCMDFYESEFKQTQKNSSKVKYHVEILSNNTWYYYKNDYINLSRENDNGLKFDFNKSVPGFELTALLIPMILLIVYFRKKY